MEVECIENTQIVHMEETEIQATVDSTLVTQPMLQLRPNWSELRSMDYYHQIFCRFQKCKRKVPPLSKDEKNLPLGIKGDFLVLRGDGGGTFSLHF